MEILKKIFSYLTFKKQEDSGDKSDKMSLKMMHGMNKISIFVFLIAMVIMVSKCVR